MGEGNEKKKVPFWSSSSFFSRTDVTVEVLAGPAAARDVGVRRRGGARGAARAAVGRRRRQVLARERQAGACARGGRRRPRRVHLTALAARVWRVADRVGLARRGARGAWNAKRRGSVRARDRQRRRARRSGGAVDASRAVVFCFFFLCVRYEGGRL